MGGTIIFDVDDLVSLWEGYALKGKARNALLRAGLTPYRVAHMDDAALLEVRSIGEATVPVIRAAVPYAGIDHATALWRHIRRDPRPSEQRVIEQFRERLGRAIKRGAPP